MFWKKQKEKKFHSKIIGQYKSEKLEITRVRTNKPIRAAKPSINIENLFDKD